MLTPGSTLDHAIVPVFPTLIDICWPVISTGVFRSTVTEATAVVIVVKPVTEAVTSIDTSTAWSDIVNKLVAALTLAVPVIGPIVPVSEFNSLPDTKTVNTPSTCPTAVVAFTPDKTAVPFAVTVVVPTEVSNSFSDPATIVVVASACIEYGPITVVNCSPVTITSGSTCISPNCVFKRFVVHRN